MPLLDCSARKCVYNNDYLCTKHEIQVEGATASTSDYTCCGSFKEGESYTDSIGEPKKATGVACDAVKCVYNDQKYCSADQIGITGSNATDAENTECATFKIR